MDEQIILSKLYPDASEKAEHILCAAIHFDDGVRYLHQPKNIETGVVVCGRRHHNVIYNWAQISEGKTRREDIQGFLTSKDRFVDRKEAGAIAFSVGQISEDTDCLFSEDLY